jgi:hypothetical protein
MENDLKMEKPEDSAEEQNLVTRRDFLAGLRKWSAAVIGVAVAGAVLLPGETTSGWVNSRGGWINGGGGGWINRRTTWVNGSGGGTGWVNRAGGGGTAWVNRRGW